MHVIEWVTKTVNRDGKNLRHLKSQKINLFQSFFLYVQHSANWKLRASYLWNKNYTPWTLFFIEKLKLSENDPVIVLLNVRSWSLLKIKVCRCYSVVNVRS